MSTDSNDGFISMASCRVPITRWSQVASSSRQFRHQKKPCHNWLQKHSRFCMLHQKKKSHAHSKCPIPLSSTTRSVSTTQSKSEKRQIVTSFVKTLEKFFLYSAAATDRAILSSVSIPLLVLWEFRWRHWWRHTVDVQFAVRNNLLNLSLLLQIGQTLSCEGSVDL